MSSNREKGQLGEDAVCEELIKRGHKIVARNYRKRTGEIDIISETEENIVFTEVKARKAGCLVSGMEAVNFTKRKHIILTADTYLTENPTKLQPRYDIAEVTLTRGETPKVISIDICEDAFYTDGIYTIN